MKVYGLEDDAEELIDLVQVSESRVENACELPCWNCQSAGRSSLETPNLAVDSLEQKWIKSSHLRKLKITVVYNTHLAIYKSAVDLSKYYENL
jgi:hypothetical protein